MTRKLLTVLVVVGLVLASVPGSASAALLDTSPSGEIVKFGAEADPSYIVSVEDGEMSALEDWANSSDRRQVVETDTDSNTALVSAPAWQVNQGLLGRLLGAASDPLSLTERADPLQLADRTYVTNIEPNYRLEYAEPIQLVNESETSMSLSLWEQARLLGSSVDTSGVAYDSNANRTTMAESRAILGVDNVTQTGDNVTVAVIDTGANTADGQVFGNGSVGSDIRIANASKNFISNTSVNATDGNFTAIEDGNGHGTWVASAIAANTSDATFDGVAPDADLLVLKALDDEGSGSTEDIRRAIRYAADQGADVISMSLGSPLYAAALADAIDYAREQGSVVVVAAGNSRQTTRWLASPADVEGALAVAATNGSEPATAGSAYFSQVGPDPGTTDSSAGKTNDEGPDVAAPGMETVAKVPTTGGSTQNQTLSGTSMATPMVAGGIALAVDANPGWSDDELVNKTREGARPMPGAAVAEVGHGMFAADNLVDDTTPDADQDESMSDEAEGRQQLFETLSNASGGLVASVARQFGA